LFIVESIRSVTILTPFVYLQLFDILAELNSMQYHISGSIERGQGAGRALGSPTANLPVALALQASLPPGLYAGTVLVQGVVYQALIYFGINSLTKTDCFEVYIKDWSGDLYGQAVELIPEKWLREPREFGSVDALRAQIQADIKAAGW
jgi:riboflavin kinase/FMN adenylyltransferase